MEPRRGQPVDVSGRDWTRVERWVLCLAFVYGAIWMLSYGSSPMGVVPVLDGAETLGLARAIAFGELPDEPFYRAPGYAAVLATGYWVGIPEVWMPMVARFFNFACHILTTLLVMRMTRRLWGAALPGWGTAFAGALYGFFPVALFFAADPLDITLAITLSMAAADQLIRNGNARTMGRELRGGLFLGLACLVRPHFLVLLPLLGLRLVLGKERRARAALGLVAAGGCLLGFGLVNLWVGGEFRPTPWQGSFNLWAANREGSTGAWLTQRYEIPVDLEFTNPARAEGEWAYRSATGETGPIQIDAINAWFKARFLEEVMEDPGRFANLIIRKVGMLLYQENQYNNKTYSFHAGREPLLGWNPLGWGVLLILMGVGLAAGRVPVGIWQIAVGMVVFALGVLVFYVSGRFRLPLVAPMVVLAAGSSRWFGKSTRGLRRTPALVAGLALGLLTFVDWGGFDQSARTSLEDRLLLGSAALQTGEIVVALEAVRPVLNVFPDRQSGLRIAIASRFEMDLMGDDPPQRAEATEVLEWYLRMRQPDPWFTFVAAVYGWRIGAKDAAIRWVDMTVRGSDSGPEVIAEGLGLKVLMGVAADAEIRQLADLLGLIRGGNFAVAGAVRAGLIPMVDAARRRDVGAAAMGDWMSRLERLLGGDTVTDSRNSKNF